MLLPLPTNLGPGVPSFGQLLCPFPSVLGCHLPVLPRKITLDMSTDVRTLCLKGFVDVWLHIFSILAPFWYCQLRIEPAAIDSSRCPQQTDSILLAVSSLAVSPIWGFLGRLSGRWDVVL